MLVLWLNFAVIKVGSISDCTDGNGRVGRLLIKVNDGENPQLELFPAGQDEFSARISGQAETEQPLTAAHLGRRAAGLWVGMRSAGLAERNHGKAAVHPLRKALFARLREICRFFHSHALNAGQSVVFKVHFIISRSVHRFLAS